MFASYYPRKNLSTSCAFDGNLKPIPNLLSIPLQTAQYVHSTDIYMSFDEVGRGKKITALEVGEKNTFLQYFIENFIPHF